MNWSDNIERDRLIKDNVPEIEMGPFAEQAMMLFGININILRSIPSVVDGLKVVSRRTLYMLHKNHKMNKVKATVMTGELQLLHPHSELGAADIYAKMSQPFSNNAMLLKAIGNSGNMTSGDDAAAPRYSEYMMTQFTSDVLFDDFDGAVNMKPSYDGSMMEPITLPAKFPLILLNGSYGIGYTLSTDIHPYNLSEVADATIKLLKNPDAKIKLVPDSPTGCDIIVKNDYEFIMQSSFEIDNANYRIIIRNTPYGKFIDDIDARIREKQSSKDPIAEIINLNDETDLLTNDFRYVIQCSKCNLYTVIKKLFKNIAGFQAPIHSRNMNVVDADLSLKKYDVRQILCAWIKNRLMEKRAWFLRENRAKFAEKNMLEGKILMLSEENIQKTIDIFKKCNSKEEIIPALQKGYNGKISSSQANFVSELRMYQLNKAEYEKTCKQLDEVKERLEYINGIVNDPEKIKEVVIDEIKTIKQKYGVPRKSKIITFGGETNKSSVGVVQILVNGSILFSETENPEHLSSDITTVSNDDVLAIDDKSQFVWIDTTKAEHDKEIPLITIGKENMGKCVFVSSSTSNNIVVLTNKGRVKYIPISRIPSNNSKKPIIPNMESDEYVVSVLEIVSEADDILVYTTDGFGKRFNVSELNKVLNLDANGQYLFKDKSHEVAGMFIINSNKPFMCYVTRLGRIRVNNTKYLSSTSKFSEPKRIINLSAQDDLISVFCVDKNQELTLYHADSRISTVNIESLNVSTLNGQAERPKHVPGIKVVRAVIK